MSIAGLIVGWRTHNDVPHVLAAYGLMVLFTFAMIWVGILLGSLLSTPEAVQGVAFIAIFPLTFVASTFVPTNTLPGVLRTIAEWNPVSALSGSLRSLFGNADTPAHPGSPWSLQHPILYVLIWVVGIIVVCAPLAVRAYTKSIGD
jgi:ABC-type polysaccharide/polyol phosphate export permease